MGEAFKFDLIAQSE